MAWGGIVAATDQSGDAVAIPAITAQSGINYNQSFIPASDLTDSASVVPIFTVQPVSQTITSGTTVVFSATASNTPSYGYQWNLNGTAIAVLAALGW